MGNMVVLGDKGDHPGEMISASGSFSTPAGTPCVEGDLFRCELRGHGVTEVDAVGHSPSCNGKKLLKTGATARCGCIITGTGSVNVS
jgi:uncharacterized Zn-binding protein involved in type VI secretion